MGFLLLKCHTAIISSRLLEFCIWINLKYFCFVPSLSVCCYSFSTFPCWIKPVFAVGVVHRWFLLHGFFYLLSRCWLPIQSSLQHEPPSFPCYILCFLSFPPSRKHFSEYHRSCYAINFSKNTYLTKLAYWYIKIVAYLAGTYSCLYQLDLLTLYNLLGAGFCSVSTTSRAPTLGLRSWDPPKMPW